MGKIKPRDLKETCEGESKYHKAKIVCFSLLMFGIGTGVQTYFQNLIYRSGIFQQRALANQETFTSFRNPLDPNSMKYLNGGHFQPSATWIADWEYANAAAKLDEGILTWSEARWDEWETMHDGVVWFDTAGCLDGGFIGMVNKANGGWTQQPLAGRSSSQIDATRDNLKNLFVDSTGDSVQPEFVADGVEAAPVQRVETWYHTREVLAMTDSYDWDTTELYRDLMKDYIDLIDDCDIDCQARGSQLTIVAILLNTVYGLVCLNALMMFIGTWRYGFRVCSVYFSIFICLFQFCVIVATGVILDSKYNKVCMRSMTKTWGVGIWTMADDFYMTGSLWLISIFTMIGFCCCAGCQVMREKTPQ